MTRRTLTYRELELCEMCTAAPSTATNARALTGMAIPQACVMLNELERIGVLKSFKRGAERLFLPTEAGARKIARSREHWEGRTFISRRRRA